MEIQRRQGEEGMCWRGAATSQGIPRTSNSHQKLGSPSELPEGTNPVPILLSNFLPPELRGNTHICCFKSPHLWS